MKNDFSTVQLRNSVDSTLVESYRSAGNGNGLGTAGRWEARDADEGTTPQRCMPTAY